MPTDLHRNEEGTISILAVFATLALTMVLGMVMNVGRQVDGKIRMQNAADAAAYSGAVTLTRGMNTLSFTNHLLCEVFSLTAILREGRDQHEKSYIPSILAAWSTVADKFSESGYPKFVHLGEAIKKKVSYEQDLADTYLAWIKAVSALQLQPMESILSEELIPKFQRNLVQYYPEIAQAAADEAARFNGTPDYGRGTMHAALWRTTGELVAYPTLPVIDPTIDAEYLGTARQQRDRWAKHYLDLWNNLTMAFFRHFGKMSQFGGSATADSHVGLWQGFTCGQLNKLIAEYPNSNLPMQIRTVPSSKVDQKTYQDAYLTYVGVAYWSKTPTFAPKVMANPISADVLTAYAQARVFVPDPNLIWVTVTTGGTSETTVPQTMSLGGVPGEMPTITLGSEEVGPSGGTTITTVGRQPVPMAWNLFNQHWTCQLAPATAPALATILQTTPSSVPELAGAALPSFGNIDSETIQQISPH